MYTLGKQQQDVSEADSSKIKPTVRHELKPYVGKRVILKGVLQGVGKWNHFLNPIFIKLQLEGTDITVGHAHIRQIDFPAGKSGVRKLRGTEKQLYQFSAEVGPYTKTDNNGDQYEDYRLENLFNIEHIEEPDMEEYELWYQEMGYTTPPSSTGHFKKNDDDEDDYIVC